MLGHHDHGHAHHPHHHDDTDGSRRAFAIGAGLNLAYVLAEAFWGFAAHSTALLADAGHNLGDVIGLGGGWLAIWLGGRHPTAQFTYGMRRSSILAALSNAVILLVVTGAIATEAGWRLAHPEPTNAEIIMTVAGAGILVNGFTAWLLVAGRVGAKRDLNVRAAVAHMLADASLTFGVMIAGAVIAVSGWHRVDPAVSLVISAVIVAGTWGLLRESLSLSLDAVPPGIDAHAVEKFLQTLPGVTEVHDLHVWALSTTETALTVHLVRSDAAQDTELLRCVPVEVRNRFAIGHATVQLETPESARACGLRPAHVV